MIRNVGAAPTMLCREALPILICRLHKKMRIDILYNLWHNLQVCAGIAVSPTDLEWGSRTLRYEFASKLTPPPLKGC